MIPDILERIVTDTRRRVDAEKAVRPLHGQRHLYQMASPNRTVETRLRAGAPAFWCEVKRGSPSRGLIAADLDPAALAQTYESAGAHVISVVTEPDHFFALPDMLAQVRAAAAGPVLQKDFFVDPHQLLAARAAGADVVLLIAAVLTDLELAEFLQEAHGLGLEALVEVHDERELVRALAAGARILGINNRNLHTFEVDLATTERLLERVPEGTPVVAESGIHTPEDVTRLSRAGASGFLIGESLVTAADPAARLRTFRRAAWT